MTWCHCHHHCHPCWNKNYASTWHFTRSLNPNFLFKVGITIPFLQIKEPKLSEISDSPKGIHVVRIWHLSLGSATPVWPWRQWCHCYRTRRDSHLIYAVPPPVVTHRTAGCVHHLLRPPSVPSIVADHRVSLQACGKSKWMWERTCQVCTFLREWDGTNDSVGCIC